MYTKKIPDVISFDESSLLVTLFYQSEEGSAVFYLYNAYCYDFIKTFFSPSILISAL